MSEFRSKPRELKRQHHEWPQEMRQETHRNFLPMRISSRRRRVYCSRSELCEVQLKHLKRSTWRLRRPDGNLMKTLCFRRKGEFATHTFRLELAWIRMLFPASKRRTVIVVKRKP